MILLTCEGNGNVYSTLQKYLVLLIWKFFTLISREARILTVNLTFGPIVRRPLRVSTVGRISFASV